MYSSDVDYGIAVIDITKLQFIEADRAFYTLAGYSDEDYATGRKVGFREFIHKDDFYPILKTIMWRVEKGESFVVNHRALTANGEIISVRCFGSIVGGNKNLYRCFFTNTTVSERKGLTLIKKKADEALKTSYDNIRGILQTIPSMIYVIHSETSEVLFFNDAAAKSFPQLSVGMKCHDAFGESGDKCGRCVLNKKVVYEDTYSDTLEITIDDTVRRYDRNASYTLWESKTPSYIFMLNPHVETEEERDLRRKQTLLQQRYAFIYRHSCDYIIDINVKEQKMHFSIVNNDLPYKMPAFSSIYEETFGFICENYVHPDDREKVKNIFSLESLIMIYDSGMESFVEEFRVILSSGETRWHEFRVFYLKEKNDYSIVISCRDITENRQIDEENQIEKKRLYTVLSNVYAMVLYINLSQDIYTIKSHNVNSIRKIQTDGRYGVLLEKCLRFVHPDDEENMDIFHAEQLLAKLRSGVEGVYTVIRMRTVDEEFHWVSIMVKSAGINAAGNVLAVAMIEIIDNEKKAEQALTEARITAEKANKAKSEFLASMSHDIRTPMNAIIGMTSIALNNLDNRAKVEDCLRKTQSSSKFLLSLINDILDMSRIESGKLSIEPSKINLNDFVGEISEIVIPQAKQKEIEFVIERNTIASIFLIGDGFRIKQVLVNLISNALKFTAKHGRVSFELQQKPLTDNSIIMCFGVRDNGIGMSAKTLATIFEPFRQGENTVGTYGGSGLGLSICLNLVKLMNGNISVQSTENSGSYFYFEIPLEIDRQIDRRATPRFDNNGKAGKPDNFTLAGKRILLVEDDEINAEIAQTVLEEKDMIVTVACNGQEALDIFSASEENGFDGILMDIHMSVMNGLEAATHIRELERPDAKKIPIIAMTANAFVEDVSNCIAHGMNGHLAKPIEPNKVYASLSKMLRN